MVHYSSRDMYLTTRPMYNDFAYSYHGKLQVPRNVSLSSRYCNLGMYSVPKKEKKNERIGLLKKRKEKEKTMKSYQSGQRQARM